MKKRLSVLQNLSILSVLIFAMSITSCQKETAKDKHLNVTSVSDASVEKALSSSLVARYPFNGNTNDVSGNNNKDRKGPHFCQRKQGVNFM